MKDSSKKINGYEKLPPQRQKFADILIYNMEHYNDIWKQGWKVLGAPQSAITNKPYVGLNNFYLTLVSMKEGYGDNRWATFHQIEENGWRFKVDKEGKSLAKGKGEQVEFYELRDRETKKPLDKSLLLGMSQEEKAEYLEKNVYPLRKYYRVFNAELIDGIPKKEISSLDEKNRVDRIENFIKFWSDKESPIYFGGDDSYYSYKKDEIHLPKKNSFLSFEQYYSTALHEIGHSTGHPSRLDRKIDNSFGTKEYAIEELRAEIASLFMEQDFGVNVDESTMRNNSAYIKAWLEEIKEDPDVLFKAIMDADRIAKFVNLREKNKDKKIEYFSIVSSLDEEGKDVYKLYMASEEGDVELGINYSFQDRNALLKELDKLKSGEKWKDTIFKEISLEKLKEVGHLKLDFKENIMAKKTNVDMSKRGVEKLNRLSDKEVVEKAKNIDSGDTFKRLYEGENIFESEEKNEEMLMMRISVFCEKDKEQLLRVFKSSGQFRDEKPNSYYIKLADKAIKELDKNIERFKPSCVDKTNGHSYANEKG